MIGFLLGALPVHAATNLPVPRFVTIKASEANIRTGPSQRYPVRWVYQRAWFPVEVTAEFEQWRKIRDMDGDEGWVHESLLSGRRSVFIRGNAIQVLYRFPDPKSFAVIRVKPGVMAGLTKCEKEWCRIDVEGEQGWIERKFLWGVYKDEVVE